MYLDILRLFSSNYKILSDININQTIKPISPITMPSFAAIQERWKNELEQAVVRLLVGLLVGIFITYHLYQSTPVTRTPELLYALAIYLCISILLIIFIIRTQSPSVFRRITGILTDMSGISITMYAMNEAGAVLFSLYLWVIMGNGLRFGKQYLYISMLCAIAGFSIVIITNSFWATHPYFSAGILIGLIALPLYFSKLLTRLTDINATLESRVSERTYALTLARDQALAANKAKTQFLATMSHELRTPLNAIIGYSEMLEDQVREDKDSIDLADLNKINYSGRHLLALIDDILDLSKIESGEITFQRKPVEVGRLLNNIIDSIQPMLKQNNNTISANIDSGLNTICVDKLRLRQVLLNLITNANKFTKNGNIQLHAAIKKNEKGQNIEITVRDTGIGISKQDISKIFDPFTQVDNTFSRQYQGSGLGLAISLNLCQMMGGNLSVESELGTGSLFTVSLPEA